ncbi:unnamed protein product [Schistosoma turkestanicum]|nr:unnamed protein product [Schistosoma turkestanicum]
MWCSYALLITLFHSVILKDVQHQNGSNHQRGIESYREQIKILKDMECEFGRLNLKYSPKLFKDINRLSNTLEMERMFINEYNLDSFAYRILGRVLMEINKLSAPTHIQRLSPAMTIGI